MTACTTESEAERARREIEEAKTEYQRIGIPAKPAEAGSKPHKRNRREWMISMIVTLIIAAGLAFIPVSIARKKGRTNLFVWWIYGWLLFIVALIHALCMEDYNQVSSTASPYQPVNNSADELAKYKALLDSGAISQEEFEAKKKQLLGQ